VIRVRHLTLAAGPEGVWQPGEVREHDDATGRALVDGGFAELLPPERRPASPAVETAAAPPPAENAAAHTGRRGRTRRET
jgi:hypothetical protein